MKAYYNEKEILRVINDNSKEADEILVAVAYVTGSGLNSIFKGVNLKDKKIKLITTTDGFITDIKAFDFIKENNIEVRLINKGYDKFGKKHTVLNKDGEKVLDTKKYPGFHSKFFVFKGIEDKGVVGSANITYTAMYSKYETMVPFEPNSLEDNFNTLWKLGFEVNESFLFNYEPNFKLNRSFESTKQDALKIQPNEMQLNALLDIENVMQKGEKSALLWAATGSGKTILAALLVRRKEYKKTLFIVHNRTIIRNAKRDFKDVIPNSEMIELFTNNVQAVEDSDVIFTTEKTVIAILEDKPNFLNQFDLIVFDEAHKIGEGNIQDTVFKKLYDMDNNFILAMTATPMRSDNPRYVINTLRNVVGKITAKEALEKGLICDFKYYGADVTDIDFEKNELGNVEYSIMVSKFLDQLNKIKTWDGSRVKGIIFVKTKEDAEKVQTLMEESGLYKSERIYSGLNDSPAKQNEIISRLQVEDDIETDYEKLNFIISINKFNEGVDIPNINTIGMFRFTESNIIYSQQIGRGLRKSDDGKKYLNIIDLVGNHKNSFERMIALNGETVDPKGIARNLKDRTNLNFDIDEVAADSIFKNLISSSKVKYNKFYLEALNEKSIFMERPLRLVEYKEHVTKNIRLLLNNLRPSKTSNVNDKSWLVIAHEAMGEDLSEISLLENKIIELFAWMPISTSTPQEKRQIIKIISGKQAILKKKWISYFMGRNIFTKKQSVSQMVRGDFSEYFNVNPDEKKISLNLDKLSEKTIELLHEIREYLISNENVNDFQTVLGWYSNAEILFMQGQTSTPAGGMRKWYSESEDKDKKDIFYTNKIFNSDSKPSDYRNEVIAPNKFIISNDKVISENDTELKYVHNYIGSKRFNKLEMFIYIGTPKKLTFHDYAVKEGSKYDTTVEKKRAKELPDKHYSRFLIETQAKLSREDYIYLSADAE